MPAIGEFFFQALTLSAKGTIITHAAKQLINKFFKEKIMFRTSLIALLGFCTLALNAAGGMKTFNALFFDFHVENRSEQYIGQGSGTEGTDARAFWGTSVN